MRWFALALIGVVGLCGSGCRAPAPTLDPFAPYGARVIPPPPTGSIGSTNGYYQPPPAGIPPAGAPATSQAPLQPVPAVATPPTTPPRTSSLPNGNWQSTGGTNSFGMNGTPTGPTMSWAIPDYGNPVGVAHASGTSPYPPPGTAVGYANPIPAQVAQTNGWPSTAPAAAPYPPPQVASQPLPIRGPGYGEPVGGETVYIPPHADPYLAAATGPTSTSSVGWQRRD